ncbi:MAG: TMEM14 family protein [Armatimonadetes bacterium]|nr:TMEM14 family protein [Armatimonadota bacterium]
MRWPHILVYGYGIFLIATGIEAASKSSISLIAGGISGLLVLACGYIIPKQPRFGYIGASVIALLIAGRFIPDAISKGKIWPSAVIGGISILVFLALGAAHMMSKSKSASEN